jgi:hypothetical protein
MTLSYDPLREAILLELNQAICTRLAQGVSFDALEQEYGLSKEAVHLILRRDDRRFKKRLAKSRLPHGRKARVV